MTNATFGTKPISPERATYTSIGERPMYLYQIGQGPINQ
jgi:hypothetical protein